VTGISSVSVSIKEFVEVLESRVWGGRKLTSVIVFLASMVIISACILFLKNYIVFPLIATIAPMFRAGHPSIHITISGILLWVLTVLIFLGIFYAFYRATTKQLIQSLDDSIQLLTAFKVLNTRTEQTWSLLEKLEPVVKKLVEHAKMEQSGL
jgi:hypothetical protein